MKLAPFGFQKRKGALVLVIMDGVGVGPNDDGNAFF